MNRSPHGTASVGDLLALKIQELQQRGQSGDASPLLRIDNREEAAQAPYQFDTAVGLLHRRDCPAIPKSSQTALYGIWEIGEKELKYACPKCQPAPEEVEDEQEEDQQDLLFGLLSIIDQFSGVLIERGREYRRSQGGKRMGLGIDQLYQNLAHGQKEVLDVVVSSLDELIGTVRRLDQDLSEQNSEDNRNDGNSDDQPVG